MLLIISFMSIFSHLVTFTGYMTQENDTTYRAQRVLELSAALQLRARRTCSI